MINISRQRRLSDRPKAALTRVAHAARSRRYGREMRRLAPSIYRRSVLHHGAAILIYGLAVDP